jgi:hypothetical protein
MPDPKMTKNQSMLLTFMKPDEDGHVKRKNLIRDNVHHKMPYDGKSPEQSMSRDLQSLRDLGKIEFVEGHRGVYRLIEVQENLSLSDILTQVTEMCDGLKEKLAILNAVVGTNVLPPLKTSTRAKSGYWNVTTQPSYKGKFKALKPDRSRLMITTEEGGGMFDSAKDAAVALRKWCIDNSVKY